ncbi:UDP-3-O-(3-hydroxymyristoyl)glucosamine N-acyltransferase [Candidatus Latescibacterota bacterium]
MSAGLAQISRLIGAEIPESEKEIEIHGVASIEDAGPDDISFISNPKYAKYLETTHAAAVIVSRDIVVPPAVIPLVVEDPYFAFLQIIELFNDRTSADIASGIDSRAIIHPDAQLGKNVSVGVGAVIGPGVIIGDETVVGPCTVILKNTTIGKNCIIYPNVTIMDGCEIGDRVILHAGTVIGSDGFGFAPHEGRFRKISQIGKVRIGSDVEIGACSCVDRAAFGVTVIEDGTKIDNLVQVAHNVRIGSNTVIASQVGISGSTSIESGVKIGGQAGFAGHLSVGDGASIGAQAGVTKDVPAGEMVSGYPAKKHTLALRLEGALRNVPDLIKKVRAQEKRITELERIFKKRS